MGDGLKNQWGVSDPAQAGSDKQSKEFQATFQKELGAINEHLQYTATHAEETRHAPLAAKRDALTPSFQTALGQIDPKNAGKAQGAINKVLASTKALGAEVAKFRKEAEKAYDDWQKQKPKCDEAVKQVEELEAWEDKEAKGFRASTDAIQKQDNSRQYAAACKALESLLPKLKPVYEEYLKQKAAKEKYDPALEALQPRLAATETSRFKKLEPMQKDIATNKQEMEKAAGEKNFEEALRSVTSLATRVEGYEQALADLEKAQEAYENDLAALQPKLSCTDGVKHVKLDPMQKEIASLKQEMEKAAQDENFELADQQAKDLLTKVDEFANAVKELEEQKKAYDDALAPLLPRLDAINQSETGDLGQLQQELLTVKGQMEEAAQKEEYVEAVNLAKNLSLILDAFESAKENEIFIIEYEGKKYCGTAKDLAVLKLKLTTAAIKNVMGPLKIKAESYEAWYNDLKSLADSHYVISSVLHAVGGASLGPAGSAVAAHKAAIEKLSGVISSDPAGAQAAYESAVSAVNATGKAISAYMDALESGGNTTIAALQVVEVTCFAVAAACGAAILAPAGATLAATMQANAIAGAGFGALQTVAEEAMAPAAWGDASKIDPKAVVTKAALNAVLSGAGGALGAAGGKGAAIVVESVMVKLGCTQAAVKVAAKEIIEGGIGNAIQSVVAGMPDLITGKTTWEQFWSAVAQNFVAGGIAGRIAGKLGAKEAFKKPITGAELDAWAAGMDKAATSGTPKRFPATK